MKKIIYLILFILIIYSVSTIKIKNISCQTQFGDCPEKYTQYFQKYQGRWYFAKITNPFPTELAKIYQYQKKLPDILIFNLVIRQPIVAITNDKGADEDGFILPIVTPELYPKLQLTQNTTISEKLSNIDTKAVVVLSTISKMLSVNLNGELTDSRLNIQHKDIQIRLDMNYLDNNWDSSLQILLDRSKIDGKVPKIIDLRFSQPVLTY